MSSDIFTVVNMVENKLQRSNKTRLGEFDLTTTVITILGPMLLLFSTAGIIMVLLQVDPLVYLIPVDLQWNFFVLLFRCIAQTVCTFNVSNRVIKC